MLFSILKIGVKVGLFEPAWLLLLEIGYLWWMLMELLHSH